MPTAPDARLRPSRLERARAASCWAQAALYAAAGAFHLATPDPFVAITPDWVPHPRQVILATGLCELAGAAALPIRRLRGMAGLALAAYAVCVYPANIKHALCGIPNGIRLGWWYHAPRLALQPVLVWWALFAGGWVSWPFGTKEDERN